jgi:hypothetical protein
LDLPAPWEAIKHAKEALKVSTILFSSALIVFIEGQGDENLLLFAMRRASATDVCSLTRARIPRDQDVRGPPPRAQCHQARIQAS